MAVYAGSVGVRLNVTITALDISAPGVLALLITDPAGNSHVVTPVIDNGPAGTCHHVTTVGELALPGTYSVRGKWWPAGGTDPIYFTGESTFVVTEL